MRKALAHYKSFLKDVVNESSGGKSLALALAREHWNSLSRLICRTKPGTFEKSFLSTGENGDSNF